MGTLSANEILEFTVSQLSAIIKNNLEETFGLVKVLGEVSGLKVHTSGHVYFSLKDANAVIDVVCWRGNRYAELLSEGAQLICQGKITSYPGRSKYQMVMELCSPVGSGALFKLFNERKERLIKEGLTTRKRPLPMTPQRIALITSLTGAALQDFLQRMQSRIPCELFIFPSLVQGKGAEQDLITALKKAEQTPGIEVIILARGGGSVEDLWCFNDEDLARAVYASAIPTISAIGHEVDFTLIDFVSDARAPTPTAAAEMVMPSREWLEQSLKQFGYNLFVLCLQSMQLHKSELNKIKLLSPLQVIEWRLQRLDEIFEKIAKIVKYRLDLWQRELAKVRSSRISLDIFRLKLANIALLPKVNSYLENKRLALASWAQLEGFNLDNILRRGFIYVRSPEGQLIKRAQDSPAEMILKWFDGEVAVVKKGNNGKSHF